MKKKVLFAAVIIFLLLVIPIPTGVYKDGGTKEFTALTYKIVDWNRIYSDGIYTKTKVYLFPLNFFSIDSLFNRENVDKTVSFYPETETDFVNDTNDEDKIEPLPDLDVTEPIVKNISFETQYIRTDGYHEDAQYPKIIFIRSVDELNNYYKENRSKYSLERRENVSLDSSIGFLDACDKYDDSYFKEKILIMVLLEEGSGSIRHTVKKIELKNTEDSNGVINKLLIEIDPIIPECGTADMAEWHIMIEPSSEVNACNEEDVVLYYNGVNLTDKPILVGSEKEYANISLKLHRNWEYNEYISDDNQMHGLEISPRSTDKGKIRIVFSKTPFAVCGTGLTDENRSVGIYDAVVYKYEENKQWSFIRFTDTPGEYLIINDGADDWLDDYDKELTDILHTLRLGEGFLKRSEAIDFANKVKTVDTQTVTAKFDVRDRCWYVYFHPKGEMYGMCAPGHQTIKIKLDGSSYLIDPIYLD